jgi:hypothetical protein
VTQVGAEKVLAVGRLDWPVQCPVDRRWLTDVETCPDCGSPLGPLRALNDLAGSLLDQAAVSADPETAVSLVSHAATLVPSTERFEVAAADALERAGRPDLALERVEAALRIAPRRTDLQERAATLRNRPAPRPRSWTHSAPWGRIAIAAVILLAFGAVGGSLLGRWAAQPADQEAAVAPTGVALASPSPAVPAETPSPTPTSNASPAPTASAPPSPTPDPARLVRAALADTQIPGGASLAVERVGDTVRISGPVADKAALRLLEAAVAGMAPGIIVDLGGVTYPQPRYVYVQPGDTMWSIAARTYGSPRRWRAIVAANPRADPAKLRVGQRLVLP